MDHRAIRRKQQIKVFRRHQVTPNRPDAITITGKRGLVPMNEDSQRNVGALMKRCKKMTPQKTGCPGNGNNIFPRTRVQ